MLIHLALGKHTKEEKKLTLLDTAKSLYQAKLENTSNRELPSLKDFVVLPSVQ